MNYRDCATLCFIRNQVLYLITYKAHTANFSRLVGVLLLYSLTRLEMPALNHIGG